MRKIIGATKLAQEIYSPIRFVTYGKEFIFSMPGNECEYKCSGVCPVKTGLKNINCKCNGILKELEAASFKQDGNFPDVIFDEEKQCFTANDGQHRICIAYHLDMDIMINNKIYKNSIHEDADSLKIPF